MAHDKRQAKSEGDPAAKQDGEPAAKQQAQQPKKKRPDGFDHFHLNKQFPDASVILTYSPKSLDQLLKDKCIFALDTNALLYPLAFNKESLAEIKTLYEGLASSQRLFVPERVVREYGRRRSESVSTLYQTLDGRRNSLKDPEPLHSPILGDNTDLQAAVNAIEAIRESNRTIRSSLDKVLPVLRNWQWNDAVSTLYAKLLPSRIVKPTPDDDKLLEDLRYRNTHQIPPGFLDSDKPDEGIGDLTIWHTLLELGAKQQKDVVFVTGESYSDWVIRQNQTILGPRFELLYEFYSVTKYEFSIVSFKEFLKLVGGSAQLVKDAEVTSEQFTAGDKRPPKPDYALRQLHHAAHQILEAFIYALQDRTPSRDRLSTIPTTFDPAFGLFQRRARWSAQVGTLPEEVVQLTEKIMRLGEGVRRVAGHLAKADSPPTGEGLDAMWSFAEEGSMQSQRLQFMLEGLMHNPSVKA